MGEPWRGDSGWVQHVCDEASFICHKDYQPVEVDTSVVSRDFTSFGRFFAMINKRLWADPIQQLATKPIVSHGSERTQAIACRKALGRLIGDE